MPLLAGLTLLETNILQQQRSLNYGLGSNSTMVTDDSRYAFTLAVRYRHRPSKQHADMIRSDTTANIGLADNDYKHLGIVCINWTTRKL